MMKTNTFLTALALVLLSQSLFAIQEYDIRFKLDALDCPNGQICYLVQLKSADGQGWNLAGQNYRIYYDASMATYISGSGISLLPENQYSSVLFTADIQNVDASAFGGDLDFANTLSFLNYSIDLMNLSNGGINLPASGEWVSTSKLCFDVSQAALDDPNECISLVWARMGKTDPYATAFVEVSQWLSTNSTTEAIANIYDDLDASDGPESCLTSICEGTGNENTTPTCSDGIDNDADGLIDCNDPSCAGIDPCIINQKSFDITLDLSNVDCVSGVACYDINLRANGSSFSLGDQHYSLFYNSGVGTFVSAISRLDNGNYQPLSILGGTPLENEDATGLGPLTFEGDLGFVDFSILLSNQASGGNIDITSGDFVTTAQICFDMTSAAINNPGTCFETAWGREGTTDVYNGFFVEIEEWVNASEIQPVSGNAYGDLGVASGDDACFDTSCGSGNETGETLCSDTLDNDNDGLIDCLDPGCSQTTGCLASCAAQAPTLSRN